MDERACPSCGAQNPAAAEYCWQCFTRFAGPPAGAPEPPVRGSALRAALGTGPGAGTPSAVLTEPVTTTRWQPQHATDRMAGVTVKVLVGLLVALVGFFGYRWLTRGFQLPDEVGGQPRMEGRLVEEFEDLMDSLVSGFDVEVQMGIYGSGFPVYVLMAAEVPEGQDVGTFYQGFVAGAGTSTGPVDPNGVTCLAMPGGAAGAQCSWVIEDTVLLLQGFTTTDDELAAVAEGLRVDLG